MLRDEDIARLCFDLLHDFGKTFRQYRHIPLHILACLQPCTRRVHIHKYDRQSCFAKSRHKLRRVFNYLLHRMRQLRFYNAFLKIDQHQRRLFVNCCYHVFTF